MRHTVTSAIAEIATHTSRPPTHHQLRYWQQIGLVVPTHPSTGAGNPNHYHQWDIAWGLAVVHLTAHTSIQMINRCWRSLNCRSKPASEVFIDDIDYTTDVKAVQALHRFQNACQATSLTDYYPYVLLPAITRTLKTLPPPPTPCLSGMLPSIHIEETCPTCHQPLRREAVL